MITEELKPLDLNPMDLGKILDRTFKMTFSNLKKNIKLFFIFIGLFIALAIVVSLILGAFYIFNKNIFENISDPNNIFQLLIVLIPVTIICLIVFSIISIFYYGMLYDIFMQSFLGNEWNIKESFKLIKQKFWTICVSGILCFFILIGGILMCVIGVIPMSIFICLVLPAILFEKKNITESIARSFKLVSYNFWSILGCSLLFGIITSFFANIFQYAFLGIFALISFIYKNDYNNLYFIVWIIIFVFIFIIFYLILFIIIYALNSAFYVLIFFNQKIKNENFGVEIMTNSIIENKIELK